MLGGFPWDKWCCWGLQNVELLLCCLVLSKRTMFCVVESVLWVPHLGYFSLWTLFSFLLLYCCLPFLLRGLVGDTGQRHWYSEWRVRPGVLRPCLCSLGSNLLKGEPRCLLEAWPSFYFAGSQEWNWNCLKNCSQGPSSLRESKSLRLTPPLISVLKNKTIDEAHHLCFNMNKVSGSGKRRQLPFPDSAGLHSASFLQFVQEKGTHCYFKRVQMQTNWKNSTVSVYDCLQNVILSFEHGSGVGKRGLGTATQDRNAECHSHEDMY